MHELSERTWAVVGKMFSAEQREDVGQLLMAECGTNLPFLENLDAVGLERFRFAVLKLSQGNLDSLHDAVHDAQRDWRDTLMSAGFGYSLTEHERWVEAYLAEA